MLSGLQDERCSGHYEIGITSKTERLACSETVLKPSATSTGYQMRQPPPNEAPPHKKKKDKQEDQFVLAAEKAALAFRHQGLRLKPPWLDFSVMSLDL